MNLSPLTNDKPIYTIVAEDIQVVARHQFHRKLTADQLQFACHAFANGMQWWDVAVCAVELAVKEMA